MKRERDDGKGPVNDIDDENRARLEKEYRDDATGFKVFPCFIRLAGEEG